MGILKRIANGLVAPKELTNYINDKSIIVFIYVFILLLIAAIPTTLISSFSPGISSVQKNEVVKKFNGDPAIPFRIVDGRLLNKAGLNDVYEYKVAPGFNAVLCQGNEIDFTNLKENNYLVLSPDKAYIYINVYFQRLRFEVFSYSDHPDLMNIDFANATKGDNIFWEEMFEIYRIEFNNLRPYIVGINILINTISSLILILGFSLMLTLFGRTELNQIYGFKNIWKLIIYAMAPYIFFQTIGLLFGENLFSMVGVFTTVIFVIKMQNHLLKKHIDENKKNTIL